MAAGQSFPVRLGNLGAKIKVVEAIEREKLRWKAAPGPLLAMGMGMKGTLEFESKGDSTGRPNLSRDGARRGLRSSIPPESDVGGLEQAKARQRELAEAQSRLAPLDALVVRSEGRESGFADIHAAVLEAHIPAPLERSNAGEPKRPCPGGKFGRGDRPKNMPMAVGFEPQ